MTRSRLSLAASPVFAAMALVTGIADHGPADVLCAAGHGPALTGMATMYLLMAVFHAGPWIRRITPSRP